MNHKKGMVMVYVIIFMLISQLVYWGSLRINQINIKRYVNFEDYYITRIQENMTENLLMPYYQDELIGLENVILEQLQTNKTKYLPTNVIEWLDHSDQFGIARIENDTYEQLYVFTQTIYTFKEDLEYFGHFDAFSWTGHIGDRNALQPFSKDEILQFDSNYIDVLDTYQKTEELLIDQGFRKSKLTNNQFSKQWRPDDIPPIIIKTNKGKTSYYRSNGTDFMTTILTQRQFDREVKGEVEEIKYFIRWDSYLFEREIDD